MKSTQEERDDVAAYLEWQLGKTSARRLTIRHVEKVAAENIAGNHYEVWNLVTSQGNWWVVTPMSNFYTQRDFKSANVVLTFHVGLTARIMSRDQVPIAEELADENREVWRKWSDAEETMRTAREAEDFQSVGMRLREAFVSMLKSVSNENLVSDDADIPQDANPEWLNLLADRVAAGSSNSRLRSYLKNVGKETWAHVNWLTHAANAQRLDAEIAVANVSHLIAVFTAARVRFDLGVPTRCADCGLSVMNRGNRGLMVGRAWG